MLTAVIRVQSRHNHTVEHVWVTFYTTNRAGNAGCVSAHLPRLLSPWAEDVYSFAFAEDVVRIDKFDLPPTYAGLVLFDVAVVPEITITQHRPKKLPPKGKT